MKALGIYLNEPFVVGFEVMMRSLLNHNPWFNVDVVIFTFSPFSDEARARCKSIYQRIVFREIDESIYNHIDKKLVPERKHPNFYKFEMFNLSEYDRVVHFDVDMVVMGDIRYLFKVPCDIAGVWKDKGDNDKSKPHYNTGVLVIGKKYLNHETYQALLNYKPKRKLTSNQDMITEYFGKSFLQLPQKWNVKRKNWRRHKRNMKIIHFTSENPWTYLKRNVLGKYIKPWRFWWNYYDDKQKDLLSILKSYKKEFLEHCSDVKYEPRGISNVEGMYLWAAVAHFRPTAILESGVYRGRSTEILARAAEKYNVKTHVAVNIAPHFYEYVKKKLSKYPKTKYIISEGSKAIKKIEDENPKRFMLFIDGPKHGKKYREILKIAEKMNAVCIVSHDCYPGSATRREFKAHCKKYQKQYMLLSRNNNKDLQDLNGEINKILGEKMSKRVEFLGVTWR